MSSRQTMITIGVALAAFVIAFVAGKAGGGGNEASAAPVGKTLSAPAAVPVTVGVTRKSLPALKAVKKKKPKKTTPKSTTPSTSSTPTPTNPTPSSPTPVPTTAPIVPAPTAAPPSHVVPNPTPVTGGGET